MHPPEVPTIDVGAYMHGRIDLRWQVAERAAAACESTGFLVIDNHGLSRPLLERAFAVSREFFSLPLEEKLSHRPDDPLRP
ncbi:MAG TPA: 2-oxoglutarate and iron-dependent oxygenase domain-containing protein, partial [Woeseiaceae bacterium]|nr:2-oxoglutarate and iron-dependent oxygenase domain-containing protein [Woeseiaceae bacterium]